MIVVHQNILSTIMQKNVKLSYGNVRIQLATPEICYATKLCSYLRIVFLLFCCVLSTSDFKPCSVRLCAFVYLATCSGLCIISVWRHVLFACLMQFDFLEQMFFCLIRRYILLLLPLSVIGTTCFVLFSISKLHSALLSKICKFSSKKDTIRQCIKIRLL